MNRDQTELQAWLNNAAMRQRECSSLIVPVPAGVDHKVVLGERVQAIVAALNYVARDVDRNLTVRCDRTKGKPREVTIFHDAGRDTLRLTWSPGGLKVGGVRRYCLRVGPAEFDYGAAASATAFLDHLAGIVAAIVVPGVGRSKAA